MENLSKKSNKGIMAKNVYGSYLNIVFSRLCAVLLIVFIIFGCSGIVALADTYKYYDLLTKNQKKIYEKFDKKWMSSKKKNAKKVEVKGKYEDCLRAIDALYNDKPYLLASNHEPWYLTYKKTVEITMKGLNSINDREYLRDYPKTLNLAGENDIETVTNIFEWLALNNKYDDVGNVPGKEKDVFHSIKGIFKHGEAVCEGYARAFKYLCDLHDIPCVLVVGDGYHSRTEFEYHMWNYVQIDGVWYGVDPTWGDNSYITGESFIDYNYFLIGNSSIVDEELGMTFGENHKPTKVYKVWTHSFSDKYGFKYPSLSDTAFYDRLRYAKYIW